MSLETKFDLQEHTIEKLQLLIRYNIDSEKGFSMSAEAVESPHLANLFRDLATERSAMAKELQNFVEWNNEEPVEEGSIQAAVHRLWINVRGKLGEFGGWNPQSILSEAKRGEEYLKEAYEDVLKEIPGNALNDVIQQQYARVKAAYKRIADLHETYTD